MESHNNVNPENSESKINYKFAGIDIDAEHSECEVECDGTKTTYRFERELGEGIEDKARLFTSASHEKITILKPADDKCVSFKNAHKKLRFFKENNPSKLVGLVEEHKTYRVIVPYMSGNTYSKSNVSSVDVFLVHFIEGVKALRKCHDAGLVVVDLKGDNIIFNDLKKKARLIDGGLSHLIGERLNSAFHKKTIKKRTKAQELSRHIAPEYWTVILMPRAKADPRGDIYSLGEMMQRMLRNHYGENLKNTFTILMNRLIDRCMHSDPDRRPTLDDLELELNSIRTIFKVKKAIVNREINFCGLNSEKEINERRDLLITQLTAQIASPEFVAACKLVNITPEDLLTDQQQKIQSAYQLRLSEINKTEKVKQKAIKIHHSTDRLFAHKKDPKRFKSEGRPVLTPSFSPLYETEQDSTFPPISPFFPPFDPLKSVDFVPFTPAADSSSSPLFSPFNSTRK